MQLPTRQLALFALVFSVACATSEDVARYESEALEAQAQALGQSQNNGPLLVLDSGHYSRYVYHGATSESFWVDLSVRNDAYQKDVGVLWTSDNWQTSHDTKASYELGLAGGRERWGIDVKDFGGMWGGQPALEVEYAAYAKMNGKTYWSPFRNHYIYQRVTPSEPVRLLTSSVSLDPSNEPILSGVVRALNLATDRKVFVRYTTNAWQSFAESEAAFNGKDFSFSVKLPFNAQSTEEVVFAVRLEAEGEARWDNNGGANYRLRLAPTIATLSFQDSGTVPASGLRVLSAAATTNLPVTGVWLRFDGGPRLALSPFPSQSYDQVNGFSSYGGVSYAFPVASFSQGHHAVVVEVGAGPFVRSSSPLGFEVDNSILSLSSWDLSTGETPWDLEVVADGHAYVMRETQIDVFKSLGTLLPERVIVSPAVGRLLDVTLDPAGRLFALGGSGVYRFLASGALDTGFADQGLLDLSGTFAGRAFCYAANLEATKNHLYLTDSCNSRVLRFGLDGVFQAELDLSAGDTSTNVTRFFDDGTRIWVGRDVYADERLHYHLVAISDVIGQAPAVVATIELDQQLQNLGAFAIAGGSIWATTGSQQLYQLDSAGSVEALWTGGGRLLSQPGAISIGRALSVLRDGSVAVLSVDTAKVERFGLAAQ